MNQGHYVYDISPACYYPKQRFTKEIIRNGFNGCFHGMKPYDLFMAILNNPKHETLLKSRQIPLLYHTLHYPDKLMRYWDSVKICIRNNYTILDGSIWCVLWKISSQLFGSGLGTAVPPFLLRSRSSTTDLNIGGMDSSDFQY